MEGHVPPKHRLTFNGLCGVISQMIERLKEYYCLYFCSHTPPEVFSDTSIQIVLFLDMLIYETRLDSMAFSPQANYTDRATAACCRS
jgi:hypothetical protein